MNNISFVSTSCFCEKFLFSMWIGLLSPSVAFINVTGTGGVLRMKNSVVNVRLGMLFEFACLSGAFTVDESVEVGSLKYFVIVFCCIFNC